MAALVAEGHYRRVMIDRHNRGAGRRGESGEIVLSGTELKDPGSAKLPPRKKCFEQPPELCVWLLNA